MKTEQRVEAIMNSTFKVLQPCNRLVASDTESMNKIKEHIRYAYTVGHDDMKADLIEAINSMFVLEQSVNYGMILNILNKL